MVALASDAASVCFAFITCSAEKRSKTQGILRWACFGSDYIWRNKQTKKLTDFFTLKSHFSSVYGGLGIHAVIFSITFNNEVLQ